jgi:hypothetical protein
LCSGLASCGASTKFVYVAESSEPVRKVALAGLIARVGA